MKSNITSNRYYDIGSYGRPSFYPIPNENENMLFFIQRNQNINTVIYEINLNNSNLVNTDLPMIAYWKNYTSKGVKKKLNHIQNELAYGYKSEVISNDLIKFKFVSYDKKDFYITNNSKGKYKVECEIDNKMAILKNVYVYAQEFGVFPIVKFIEIYGIDSENDQTVYEKIIV